MAGLGGLIDGMRLEVVLRDEPEGCRMEVVARKVDGSAICALSSPWKNWDDVDVERHLRLILGTMLVDWLVKASK